MAGLGDAFGEAAKKLLFEAGLNKGDIFLNKFDGIDHPKFFVVAGLSGDKVFTCSVYINSNIHPALFKKQELLNLQVPIKKADYDFLDHDSWVCCSTPLYIESVRMYEWMQAKSCKVISQLKSGDLANVTQAITGSGLLSDEELEIYFS